MAHGLLASVRPAATTETVLYTVPASYKAIVNLTFNVANSSAQSLVRVGIQSAAGAFADKDYIFYDYMVGPNEPPIQVTGISLTDSQSIRIYVSVANVNFHVNGIEELL